MSMLKLNDLSKWHQKFETFEEMTSHLQKMLIDFQPIETDYCEIIGFNRSSDLLGGDYIGLIPNQDGSLLISIGDVMGKGLSAGFLMGMIHGALKGIAINHHAPNEQLRMLNQAMIRDFNRFNAFATFSLSQYDEKSRLLRWSNAGQNYPILYKRKTGHCRLLELKGVMIGVIEPLSFQLSEEVLEHGDIVLWYSDGLIELMNEERKLFGLNKVLQLIEGNAGGDLKTLTDSLLVEAERFRGGINFNDDISFIALKVK